ncbi:aryl-sulfate sulfotransferase [Brachyspira innocens]|uniref:aryl-sulfate sulfotransferase n=1 Tax=Brachyspira innocens TaxID=13264 RepID=UPI0003683BD3|nr:aryl-sulfate sulfotransferase [Brachyspira innocens]
MKKLLFIILLVTVLFALSCNHNKLNSSLTSSIGKVGEIVVDPYGVTPLSAVYTTETVNAAPITVIVKGLYGEPDIIHTYPAGYGTEFEIHGMFAESQNTIEVNDGGRIITKNVNIGKLFLKQNNRPVPREYDVKINNLPEEKYTNNPDLYFSIGAGVVGVSRNGYVRYVMDSVHSFKLVIDKKIYIHNIWSTVNSIGKTILNYPTVSHHDIIKVNNNYLYLSSSEWGSEDRMVEIDSSGKEIRRLNFAQLIKDALDIVKYPEDEYIFKKIAYTEDINNIYENNGVQKSVNWFHANSLVYDLSTDILYVSSRDHAVLAIDYSEWKLIWWMVDSKLNTIPPVVGYDKSFKDLKSLEPYRVKGDALNDGPKNQHALFLHKNGNLGMFDNQGDETTNPNGSRYVEYKITGTHGNYIAQKVYEYRDSSLYSRVVSDVDFTSENYKNLLICYGYPSGRILEIDKNSKIQLFRIDIIDTSHTYRVDKMPLYYDEGRVYSEDCNLKNPN